MSGSDKTGIDRTLRALSSTRKSVRATELFTLAMLPKLRHKAEDAVAYYDIILESLENIANTEELRLHTNFATPGAPTLIVLITSSKGMCGPYNRNVFEELERLYSGFDFEEQRGCDFATLGEKGRKYVERFGRETVRSVDKGLEDISLQDSVELATWLVTRARDGSYSKIYVVYTKYLDALHSEATTMTLFPLLAEGVTADGAMAEGATAEGAMAEGAADGGERRPGSDRSSALSILDFEEEATSIIDQLVDNYFGGMLYSLLRYSVASEYSQRRLAMQLAKRGIDDELKAVRMLRKRVVMQERTNELLEVVNNQQAMRRGVRRAV